MTKLKALHAKWTKDPEYRKAYESLEEEFALAAAIAAARSRAGLTQEQVAQRMHTTQSNIARLEAGRTRPSTQTLEKFAEAVGARLRISFEPIQKRSRAAAQRRVTDS
jgi:transcriptional regulator with XRE-family HTH domain